MTGGFKEIDQERDERWLSDPWWNCMKPKEEEDSGMMEGLSEERLEEIEKHCHTTSVLGVSHTGEMALELVKEVRRLQKQEEGEELSPAKWKDPRWRSKMERELKRLLRVEEMVKKELVGESGFLGQCDSSVSWRMNEIERKIKEELKGRVSWEKAMEHHWKGVKDRVEDRVEDNDLRVRDLSRMMSELNTTFAKIMRLNDWEIHMNEEAEKARLPGTSSDE